MWMFGRHDISSEPGGTTSPPSLGNVTTRPPYTSGCDASSVGSQIDVQLHTCSVVPQQSRPHSTCRCPAPRGAMFSVYQPGSGQIPGLASGVGQRKAMSPSDAGSVRRVFARALAPENVVECERGGLAVLVVEQLAVTSRAAAKKAWNLLFVSIGDGSDYKKTPHEAGWIGDEGPGSDSRGGTGLRPSADAGPSWASLTRSGRAVHWNREGLDAPAPRLAPCPRPEAARFAGFAVVMSLMNPPCLTFEQSFHVRLVALKGRCPRRASSSEKSLCSKDRTAVKEPVGQAPSLHLRSWQE